MIYFLFAPKARAVKIGYSKDVDSRIRTLQTGNHEPLELLGTIDGAMSVERLIHAELKNYRLIGEWFDFKTRVRVFVETCIATGDWLKAKVVWTLPSVGTDSAAQKPVQAEASNDIPDGLSDVIYDFVLSRIDEGLTVRRIEKELRTFDSLSKMKAKQIISIIKSDPEIAGRLQANASHLSPY